MFGTRFIRGLNQKGGVRSVALIVHIYLSIARADLAKKEYEAAKKWADDSLLIQMIEATIGLAVVGALEPCGPATFD